MSGLDMTTASMAYQAQAPQQVAPKNATLREMNKQAQDFEAFFLSQALQPMFENIEPEGPFGGGAGSDIWKSMQVDEYGKALAKSGGIGIADAVMKQLLIAQEGMNR